MFMRAQNNHQQTFNAGKLFIVQAILRFYAQPAIASGKPPILFDTQLASTGCRQFVDWWGWKSVSTSNCSIDWQFRYLLATLVSTCNCTINQQSRIGQSVGNLRPLGITLVRNAGVIHDALVHVDCQMAHLECTRIVSINT